MVGFYAFRVGSVYKQYPPGALLDKLAASGENGDMTFWFSRLWLSLKRRNCSEGSIKAPLNHLRHQAFNRLAGFAIC